MRFLLFFLFHVIIMNNTVMPALRISDNEVLIASVYKEIENGYIIFLIPIGDETKEITYSYSIDTLNRKVTCSRLGEKVYSSSERKKCLNSFRFKTADEFNKKQKKSWREKYYKYFADDFLDMTNDKKINLLDEMCAIKI
ncbi:hypothetical protein [Bacteroides nordii]|uniref:hypothetical protein n=1 Tax=Bacteroides nordii TaxID=291645 RepID=UPI002A82D21B|nr:hypothetical protein [Bacteroides nordii]